MGKEPGGEHRVADPGAFVCAVETGVNAGERAVEGHATGDVLGAAAGGEALTLEAGVLLVALQKHLHEV